MSQESAEQLARQVLAADAGVPTDVLLLPRNASLEQARAAYKRLAMSLHPDKNPSATAAEAFQRCRCAVQN